MNLSRQQMSPPLFLPQTPPDHHLRIPPGQVFWCPRVKSPLALHNLFSCQLFRNSCRGNAVSSLSFFSVYKRKNLLSTRCVRKKLVANLPTSCNNAIQGCHSFVERQDSCWAQQATVGAGNFSTSWKQALRTHHVGTSSSLDDDVIVECQFFSPEYPMSTEGYVFKMAMKTCPGDSREDELFTLTVSFNSEI